MLNFMFFHVKLHVKKLHVLTFHFLSVSIRFYLLEGYLQTPITTAQIAQKRND